MTVIELLRSGIDYLDSLIETMFHIRMSVGQYYVWEALDGSGKDRKQAIFEFSQKFTNVCNREEPKSYGNTYRTWRGTFAGRVHRIRIKTANMSLLAYMFGLPVRQMSCNMHGSTERLLSWSFPIWDLFKCPRIGWMRRKNCRISDCRINLCARFLCLLNKLCWSNNSITGVGKCFNWTMQTKDRFH